MAILIVVAALAAFWTWRVMQFPALPWYLRWPRNLVRALTSDHFVKCPWCFGGWLALIIHYLLTVVATSRYRFIDIFSGLAAAALVGLLALLIPDDGEPE